MWQVLWQTANGDGIEGRHEDGAFLHSRRFSFEEDAHISFHFFLHIDREEIDVCYCIGDGIECHIMEEHRDLLPSKIELHKRAFTCFCVGFHQRDLLALEGNILRLVPVDNAWNNARTAQLARRDVRGACSREKGDHIHKPGECKGVKGALQEGKRLPCRIAL